MASDCCRGPHRSEGSGLSWVLAAETSEEATIPPPEEKIRDNLASGIIRSKGKNTKLEIGMAQVKDRGPLTQT